jgi:hypothetical protein
MFHGGGDRHFITCSCYRRQPSIGSARRRDLFLEILEEVRRRFKETLIEPLYRWRQGGAAKPGGRARRMDPAGERFHEQWLQSVGLSLHCEKPAWRPTLWPISTGTRLRWGVTRFLKNAGGLRRLPLGA